MNVVVVTRLISITLWLVGDRLRKHEAEARERLTILHDDGTTSRQRVAGVSVKTEADWSVMVHLTLSVETARAHARVTALVVDTSPVARAVRVEHTLRATPGPGVAEVAGRTGAGAGAVAHLAHCVGPAGARHAGVTRCYRHVCHSHTVHWHNKQQFNTGNHRAALSTNCIHHTARTLAMILVTLDKLANLLGAIENWITFMWPCNRKILVFAMLINIVKADLTLIHRWK